MPAGHLLARTRAVATGTEAETEAGTDAGTEAEAEAEAGAGTEAETEAEAEAVVEGYKESRNVLNTSFSSPSASVPFTLISLTEYSGLMKVESGSSVLEPETAVTEAEAEAVVVPLVGHRALLPSSLMFSV